MGVVVKYEDIALGAKQDFEVETAGSLPNSNENLFKEDMGAEKWGGYTIPFELNSMVLDGTSFFLPDEEGTANISFISEQISDADGNFIEPIQFVLQAGETYVSSGISVIFDELKNVYATRMNIEWYNDDLLIDTEDFEPTSANYFCSKNVSFYNKIIITFYSVNLPYHRLRVNLFEYGLTVSFGADELKKAKVIQEIDPISSSVPINTFDFTVDSKRNVNYTWQARQPVTCYFDNSIRAKVFVKSAKRKSKTIWDIQCEDYVGIMDTVYFKGGIYESKDALELIDEIFYVAKIPYNVLSDFSGISLTGHIPYTTCREALMQVVFAMGAVVDTSDSYSVDIFGLSNEVNQEIQARRIAQGQSFSEAPRVTAVELTSHSFNAKTETLVAYEAEKSGTGDDILVEFSEPLHDLSITSGSILERGANFARIKANAGCVLTGQKYEHTTVIHRKDNPLVLSTDIENIISIENATLVSSNNVDKLLGLCYNYLVQTDQTSMKIFDGKNDAPTKVGDKIKFETEYLGEREARIIKQSFSMSGGILMKDTTVR